jgi:group I intron endonuclease
MIYSIYKITNKVNNKVYIGFTQNVDKRWKNHSRSEYNRPLYNSIRKHGIDNFTFEIIYQSKDREHTLVEMEPFFIEEYNSYNNGYNCVKGGLNTNTDEMRRLSSDRMRKNNPMKVLKTNRGTFQKGHKPNITKERNEKIRQSKLGSNNHNFNNPNAAAPLNTKVTCEVCGKETNKGNYVRWHKTRCNAT